MQLGLSSASPDERAILGRFIGPAGFAAALLAVGLPAQEGSGAVASQLLSSIDWQEDAVDFGGLSGLALYDQGTRLVAVGDGGFLYQGRLMRDANGRLTGAKLEGTARFLDNFGKPADSFSSDAEAIRLDRDGSILVAFESYARVARFRLPDMMPQPLQHWDRFRSLWGNSGMESLALSSSGRILTIVESPSDDGSYRTLDHLGGEKWGDGPSLASDGMFSATDADYGPDGRLYVLERDFSALWGYRTRISAYAPEGSGFGPPDVVLLTEPGTWGDFEGMDVWADPKGRLIATLIADDNFLPLSPTTIAEFDLGVKTGQSGNP